MRISGNRSFLSYGFLLAPLLLSGCSRAPSFDIMGSFFPSWLVSFIVAVVLTAMTRLALQHFRLRLAFPILTYASLAAFFSFALWLIFLH